MAKSKKNKKSPTPPAQETEHDQSTSNKRFSIKTIIIAAILIASTIALATLIPAMFADQEGEQQNTEPDKLAQYAASLAENVNQSLSDNAQKLELLSQSAEIQSFFNQYDQLQADKLGNSKLAYFNDGILLKLLPHDIDQVPEGDTTQLTFASLLMVREALESPENVKAEWHLPGQKDEFIALVQRVYGAKEKAEQTTDNVIGVLHLRMKTAQIIQAFADHSKQKGIITELKQTIPSGGSVLLSSAGSSSLKSSSQQKTSTVKPVSNTRWHVKVIEHSQPVIDSSNLPDLKLPAIGTLLFGLLFWLWKRKPATKIDSTPANTHRARIITPGERQQEAEEELENPTEEKDEKNKKQEKFLSQDVIEVQELDDNAAIGEDALDDELDIEIDEELELDLEPEETGEVEEINDMSTKTINEAENAPASIFRAYDIRGIVGDTLTEKIVYNVGKALGSEAIARGDNTVVVGRDGRLSSPSLSEALIRGLTESGRDVIDIGMVPTPVLYFGAHFFDTTSGIMITGSHNPANYNGIKMVLAGTTLADEAIQSLRQRILDDNYTTGENRENGQSQIAEIGSEYIRRITDDIPVALSNSFKVVVDAGNGVAGALGPQLLRALGHDVIELYCEIDGNFPNHHPDPSQPENLQELIELVQSEDADIGLAFDGDGDRLGVVDREGNIIYADRQMMLFAQDVISRNPGGEIIFDVKCSNHLRRVIEEAGGKATMWKTGHSLVKAKMKETGALLAGEMSGHVFFKERWYGFDDGLYTAARLLEILTKADQPPHEILGNLPGGVATPELRLDLHEDQHGPFMANLSEVADFGDGEVGTIDGIRVDFPDAWGLIRPSNTTPCLVMRFEADNEQALEKVQTLFRDQLLAMDSSLQLPF